MAMKKPNRKGDEPVRVGLGKAQTVKGFVHDPFGYVSGRNANPGVQQKVKSAVASAKGKYGTKFVVDVSMDGVVRTIPRGPKPSKAKKGVR